MKTFKSEIIDAFDIETFLLSDSHDDAKVKIMRFLSELGFDDIDVISIDFRCFGARVRARVYINRPGCTYSWLTPSSAKGSDTSEI